MRLLIAAIFLFAGFTTPACCCETYAGERPAEAPSGCCAQNEPEPQSCPGSNDCPHFQCVAGTVLAAVAGESILAEGPTAGVRTPTLAEDLYLSPMTPAMAAKTRRPLVCAAGIPRRYLHCVYLM